jgi:hypothetical protein
MKVKAIVFIVLMVLHITACSWAEAMQLSAMSQEAIMANNKWRNGIKRYSIEIMPPKLKKYKDRSCLEVNGKSNFPDDTRIYVFLKKGNHSLDCKVVRLTNGLFTTSFGPLDLKKFEGEYEIEASLMRIEQNTAKVKKIIGEKGQNITDVADGTIIDINDKQIERISAFSYCTFGDRESLFKKRDAAEKQLKNILLNLEIVCNQIYTSYNDIKEQNEFLTDNWVLKQAVWEENLRKNEKEIECNYELSALDDYSNVIKYLELIISNIKQLEAVCADSIGLQGQTINKYKSSSPETLVRVIKTDIARLNRSMDSTLLKDEEATP